MQKHFNPKDVMDPGATLIFARKFREIPTLISTPTSQKPRIWCIVEHRTNNYKLHLPNMGESIVSSGAGGLSSVLTRPQRTTKELSSTCTSPDIALLPVSLAFLADHLYASLLYCSRDKMRGHRADARIDRLITAKDHASIQIRIADVDADGKAIRGQATTIAICGKVRAQGDSDDSINRIAQKEGGECHDSLKKGEGLPRALLMFVSVLKNVWTYSR